MNASDVVGLLAETTVATSVAILFVLWLRRPLRRHFGAGAGYGLWLLVPAALTAVLLPAATVVPAPVTLVHVAGSMDAQVLAAASETSVDVARWLSALWLLGVAAVALWLARQQYAFTHALGTLRACGPGMFRADTSAGLPAAIGLWRPMIVLPADFESRYTPRQRALMQAHERSHIQRGDLQLSALVAVLRCLFWFNPLMHLAARCFRHDQELACDQRVIARHPESRRDYGDAMFQTQLAAQPLPLGCHWGLTHPLKERIAMLKQPVPSPARWLCGSAIVLGLALCAGAGAWAAQPKNIAAVVDVPAGKIRVQLSARIDDRQAEPPIVMLKNPGELFSFEIEEGGHLWELTGSSRMLGDGQLQFSSVVQKDGAWYAEPSLVVANGEPASLAIGERSDDGSFKGLQLEVVLEGVAGTVAGTPANTFVPAGTAGAVAPTATRESRQVHPPRYPADALKRGVSGKVVLLVDIDAKGQPTAVEVASADPAGVFDQAAIDAAWNWTFSPAIENGKPVPSRISIPVQFEADGTPPEKDGDSAEMMSWVTTNTSARPPRIAEFGCDVVRGDADGDEVACGNRLTNTP